eukprot:EG_transcript_3212
MSLCDASFEHSALNAQSPPHPEQSQLTGPEAEVTTLDVPVPFRDVQLNEDDFKCSICLYLWHKPCINSCGHAFCFWCIHLAMNGLGSSQCPLCRTPYTHLPDICVPLHHFVAQRFPEEARSRAAEVAREEQLVGVHSPALPAPPAEDVLATGFRCHHCSAVARGPTVTRCGHLFCQPCLAELVAQGPVWCPVPGCSAYLSTVPNVCITLQDLLHTTGAARGLARGPKAPAALLEDSPAKPLGGPAGDVLEPSEPPLVPRVGKTGPEGPDMYCEGADHRATTLKALPFEKPFSPIEDFETAMQDPTFIHFGIICDSCGAYPIVGHRWRCRDCPEKIGFDICGECYTRQVHRRLITGKFNQSHQPTHRMHLVAQVKDWLHELQGMHPELSVTQLLQLVDLALQEVRGEAAPAGEGEGQGEGAAGGNPVDAVM